jgi:hypothetical protein
MSRVGSCDNRAELALRREIWRRGYRYRLYAKRCLERRILYFQSSASRCLSTGQPRQHSRNRRASGRPQRTETISPHCCVVELDDGFASSAVFRIPEASRASCREPPTSCRARRRSSRDSRTRHFVAPAPTGRRTSDRRPRRARAVPASSPSPDASVVGLGRVRAGPQGSGSRPIATGVVPISRRTISVISKAVSALAARYNAAAMRSS